MTLYLEKSVANVGENGELLTIPSFVKLKTLYCYRVEHHLNEYFNHEVKHGDMYLKRGNYEFDEEDMGGCVDASLIRPPMTLRVVFVRNFVQEFWANPKFDKTKPKCPKTNPWGFVCLKSDHSKRALGVKLGYEKDFASSFLFFSAEHGLINFPMRGISYKFYKDFIASYVMSSGKYRDKDLRGFEFSTEIFKSKNTNQTYTGLKVVREFIVSPDSEDALKMRQDGMAYMLNPKLGQGLLAADSSTDDFEGKQTISSISYADEDGIVIEQEDRPKQIAKQESRSQPKAQPEAQPKAQPEAQPKAQIMKKNSFVSTLHSDELNQEIPF